MSILSPLFFCESQQILIFLSLFGSVTGFILFINRGENKIDIRNKVLHLSVAIIVIFFLYYLAFTTAYTSKLIIISFFVSYFLILYILMNIDFERRGLWTIIFLLLLFTYFIAGITGNACLYLPTTNENNFFNFSIGDRMNFWMYPPNLLEEILHCNVTGFEIREIKIEDRAGYRGVGVNIYSNETLIHQTWISEGEELTICPAQFTLVGILDNTSTTWEIFSKDDIFSNIQDWFIIKGIYKNIKI